MNKQTHFESPDALGNAEVMLDVCREEYERAGHKAASKSLWGLDVKSYASTHLALVTVHALPDVTGLIALRQCAVEAMRRALASWQPALRQAC